MIPFFFIITLLISWCLCGYFIFIYLIGLFRKDKAIGIISSLPMLSLIIPCYNEEKYILSKLENIRKLNYPKDQLEIYFVDGGSSDQTIRLLSNSIRSDDPCQIVQSPNAGKIRQLNYILPKVKGDIIVNSDADAELSPDSLKWIVAEFNRDNNIFVVGAYCRPANSIDVDQYYWSAQNKGRFLESDSFNSSIVIAQCYAFRRGFLDRFPEDVIADDIYAAFLAYVRGGKTIYSRQAKALEKRCPQNYRDFLSHKFRKSNAYLKESLRFLRFLPGMYLSRKILYMTRIMQQILLPWMLLFWFSALCLLLTLFRYDIVIMDLAFIALLFLITKFIFIRTRLPDESRKYSIFLVIKGYLFTFFILLMSGITYPFFKQDSHYQRFEEK